MAEAEIRRIEVGEIELLRPLWNDLFAHHSALDDMPPRRTLEDSWETRRETYRGWLQGGDAAIFIAEIDGRPVGYGSVTIGSGATTWDLGEKTAELETLAVLEEARGSGVGQELVAAARAFAAERGAKTLIVAVAHSNDSALGFYGRFGFKPFYVDLTLPTED